MSGWIAFGVCYLWAAQLTWATAKSFPGSIPLYAKVIAAISWPILIFFQGEPKK